MVYNPLQDISKPNQDPQKKHLIRLNEDRTRLLNVRESYKTDTTTPAGVSVGELISTQ